MIAFVGLPPESTTAGETVKTTVGSHCRPSTPVPTATGTTALRHSTPLLPPPRIHIHALVDFSISHAPGTPATSAAAAAAAPGGSRAGGRTSGRAAPGGPGPRSPVAGTPQHRSQRPTADKPRRTKALDEAVSVKDLLLE